MSVRGLAVLLRRFAVGLRMALRFCCGGLPSVCAWHCGSVAAVCPRFAHGFAILLERLAFGSRLSFVLCQEKRDGLRCLAFLFRRVEIAIRAFSECQYGYLPLAGSLRVWSFLYGDLDGVTGVRRTGIRGWRRGLCASLRRHIGVAALSAGSTLGLRAPNLRQRVFDSLDSLHAAAELCWCVFVAFVRFCAGALALQCFPRGVRWGCAPQTAPKSRMWKRHCRLSGLSSRCGGVVLAQIRGACTLLRGHIGLAMLSAGSTLGATRPQTCAKESSTLWTLFRGWPSEKVRFTHRGCVGADSLRRHPGTRVDPTGSNLWPGGSCCTEMIPIRSIVQTRAAPKRRGVGLQRAKRCGSRHCRPGGSCCTEMIPIRSIIQTRAAPQAAKSRVACAKRCGGRHCRPGLRTCPPSR